MAAKGDVKLVADIKDGYVEIAYDFLDDLNYADLSAAETRVVMFIIRRTLENKKSDKNNVQFDLILASEISKGTQLKKSYVRKCIASLTKKKIVVSEKASVMLAGQQGVPNFGAERFYGINFNAETWEV